MSTPPNNFSRVADVVASDAADLFDQDHRITAIGIGWMPEQGYGLRVVRNYCARLPGWGDDRAEFSTYRGLPVFHGGATAETRPCTEIPAEQGAHRPPVCGIQIQNFDDDDRQGRLGRFHIKVGTLGCFVRRGSRIFLLSNNHVLAGNNSGWKDRDRILNPGNYVYEAWQQIAILHDFHRLVITPRRGPGMGQLFNEIDAAIAEIDGDAASVQGTFLNTIAMNPPRVPTAHVRPGDLVRKVGRTTGLTEGRVTGIKTLVGPIEYEGLGDCWFQDVIEIESVDGNPFCECGDSGAVVLNDAGEVVGLLFATNQTQSYCCSIDKVLAALNVTLL